MAIGAKSDPKTMRFDANVISYIEKFKGSNFSEKFHNMVYLFMDKENDQMQQISLLEIQIAEKEKRLKNLSDMIYKVGYLERHFKDLQAALDGTKGYLEHFLPKDYEKSINPPTQTRKCLTPSDIIRNT